MDANVFGCSDLRRLIFSYLRMKPDKACVECKKVLVWDKKVCDYTLVEQNVYFGLKNAPYCMHCYYRKINVKCNIL